MKQFFRDNGGLIVVAALLLAAVLAVGSYIFGADPLTGALEVLATPFRTVSAAVTQWAQDRYDRAFRYEELLAENETLRQRIAELEEDARNGADAVRENERLKDLLGLAEARPELTYRDAEVTRGSDSNWASNFTIDRGTADDVAVDDCVIDQYGNLVGVVTEVGLNWATVTTILDPGAEIGGRVARSNEDAILAGDFTLMLEGLLKLTFVRSDAQLMAGDQVTTSGLGGVYPPGILVGTLRELSTGPDGISRIGVVEPAADISGVRYVYVITDYGAGE